MPFVLLAFGLLFLVVAWQNTAGDLFALLKSEFVGTNSFLPWIAALLILGLLGYIRPIKPVTHAFIALIFLVLILANGTGFFDRFNQAVRSPVAPSGGGGGTNTGTAPDASPATSGFPALPFISPASAGTMNAPATGAGYTGSHSGGNLSQMIDVFGPQEE